MGGSISKEAKQIIEKYSAFADIDMGDVIVLLLDDRSAMAVLDNDAIRHIIDQKITIKRGISLGSCTRSDIPLHIKPMLEWMEKYKIGKLNGIPVSLVHAVDSVCEKWRNKYPDLDAIVTLERRSCVERGLSTLYRGIYKEIHRYGDREILRNQAFADIHSFYKQEYPCNTSIDECDTGTFHFMTIVYEIRKKCYYVVIGKQNSSIGELIDNCLYRFDKVLSEHVCLDKLTAELDEKRAREDKERAELIARLQQMKEAAKPKAINQIPEVQLSSIVPSAPVFPDSTQNNTKQEPFLKPPYEKPEEDDNDDPRMVSL